MKITLKLGGPLRKKVEGLVDGEIVLDLPDGAHITTAIEALGLKREDVKLVMHNHKAAPYDYELQDGDRLGLFPPQLAYNMYVALSFRSELKPEE